MVARRWLDNGFLLTGCLVIGFIGSLASVVLETWWVSLLIPVGVVGGYLVLFDHRFLYGLLFFAIPMSSEVALFGGLSTDLIGEPILWTLSGICMVYLIVRHLPRRLVSWMTCLMIFHLGWIAISAVFAHDPLIAVKYTLAKSWFVLPMYVLPFYIIDNSDDIRFLMKCFLIGSLVAAFYFFVQHWQTDLAFTTRTNAGQPIWRNHVNYACTLVLNLPLLWYLYKTSQSRDRWLYIFCGTLVLFFAYFAFARIAYLSILSASLYYIVLRLKLTRPVVFIALGILLVGSLWVTHNQRYVELAPQYEKAITQGDFQSKISATTQGTDISTMERVHRWVAGGHMISDHPWTGVGPGNFYPTYRPYTVYSFETYVSDNPDHSGIHSHYFMTLVEQGFIGLAIWLVLLIYAVILIEQRYHSLGPSLERHSILMCGFLLSMILTINLVNDMIEVIKIGCLFFFALFLLQAEFKPDDSLS